MNIILIFTPFPVSRYYWQWRELLCNQGYRLQYYMLQLHNIKYIMLVALKTAIFIICHIDN